MHAHAALVALSGLMLLGACVHAPTPDADAAPEGTPSEAAPAAEADPATLAYPDAPRGDVVDDYHGTKVADPYRWLENPDSPASRKWIEAENELTFGWLKQIPAREKIRERLTRLWDYEKFGVPFKEGGRYFYEYNPGLANQSILYVMDRLGGEPRVLLDPNGLSEDGTVAVTGMSVSPDGRRLAYATSSGGSDWKSWHVRDVDTGEDLPDLIEWSKFSDAAWTHDGAGFYYSAYDAPKDPSKALRTANYFQKLYFHRVGTPQSEDVLVYERKDHKDWGFYGITTDDGRYLVIHVSKGTSPRNAIFYQDLKAPKRGPVALLKDFDARYEFLGNQGPVFWFLTDLDAPRGRIVTIDLRHPASKHWTTLVPETKDTLETASLVGDRLVATYMVDAKNEVRVFSLKGKPLSTVGLPALGSVGGFRGKIDDPETFFSFTSFTYPTTIYRYDVKTGRAEVFKAPKVDFDRDAFVTEQVFYESKDGTRVPMFVVHKKGLALDGTNPTYLYGYGGFNISLTPWFSISNAVWLEMGGVFALPNLRGGGEYGEAWHEAGTKLNKQNVFDDFIAAAEWLIEKGYTSKARLSIGGGSNGGLLVGACETQRPDLFAAAAPAVGVLDMLRYHTWTIGWAWASDYGTSEDPEEFQALYAYSPYHNVKDGTSYPATFITTGDHDDRVVPAHSFKFAAALQHAQKGDAPILIRIETRAGHGAGKPTEKIIDEVADKYAFLARVLGMTPFGEAASAEAEAPASGTPAGAGAGTAD